MARQTTNSQIDPSPKGQAKQGTKKVEQPVNTAQRLGSVIKSARDLLRKDKGLNGELDRLPQLTWMMFLKLLDDMEKLREQEALLEGKEYKTLLQYPYRWRDWVKKEGQTETSLHLLSGDALLRFIDSEEVTLPDNTKHKGLFAYLRSLQSLTGRDREDVVREVFKDISNRMISGALLRDVLNKMNEIHFDNSEEMNVLSNFYESMLKEMRDAAGDSGEFYTPRALVRFMVKAIAPKLGEKVKDPACGTGGFLIETYEYLKANCASKDWQALQSSITGIEAKPLPYMLSQMNLLLHGVEYPDIEHRNALAQALTSIGIGEQVDVILANPPFGGEEETKIKGYFPPDKQTSETALLFLQLIMRSLKIGQGRAGVVVPNGVLFGDGICARIKEELLTKFNLHTIVRLPNGVFEPYTSIPSNLLFFDATKPTDVIWYYEILPPEGMKKYSKTKPMQDEEFNNCLAWWGDRDGDESNDRVWRYEFRATYEQARAEATPFWDAAKSATAIANGLAKQVKELEDKIQSLPNGAKEITGLKQALKSAQKEEQNQRAITKDEQSKGDAIYWVIYNLDRKNPVSQQDFEHLPPERLLADILIKDRRVDELMAEIEQLLGASV
ncbi:N-6 DNA methylase [Pseudanabaena sp. FACHB-1998]|uniref:class I SAM-dependent DNA methyltransferase n=1 Tax=Pseudanabaena sp. FACHB-1998 TaxID=2692858 RepID=UPI00167FF177|nr:N-6 DNA methylase [Pseudanabaena sp. FACHB-1998]MBD2175838.1 N-6 DNA methylase [Pseudanabaena sp. FACHB-1998]